MGIVKDGFSIIIPPIVVGLIFLFLPYGRALNIFGLLLVVIGLFFSFFYRDPARTIVPQGKSVLSPCDGTVLEITDEDGFKVMRIFLSVFSVHLQRSPVDGKVTNVVFTPGKFLPAMKPEAHAVNQNNVITIESDHGTYKVKQISGILARRVISWVKPGEAVKQGGKIGFIKFGSQVDVYCPKEVSFTVGVGEKVTAGITVLGKRS